MRKEFFSEKSFDTIDHAQQALDGWIVDYNHEREHQSLGDVPPIRRFELAASPSFEVSDGEVAVAEEPQPRPKTVSRRVDHAGRISILKHRYHVGRHLTGEAVIIESRDGLLNVTHNGVVVATHARRHLIDDDDKMDRRAKASRPSAPTKGGEVLRVVDSSGGVSFAGTMYRVGNRFIGQTAGVRLVGDTVQTTIDGASSGRIEPATTEQRSSEPSLSPTANPGRPPSVGHSYRSQSGTRVVRLHRPNRLSCNAESASSNTTPSTLRRTGPVALAHHFLASVVLTSACCTRVKPADPSCS
jgi:hypothetical protein